MIPASRARRAPIAIGSQSREGLAPMLDPLERGDRLSASPSRPCAWRPCGRDFVAPRLISAYCCNACRLEAARWRSARGAAMVPAVLDLTASRRAGASAEERAAGRLAWRWLLQRGRDLDRELTALHLEREAGDPGAAVDGSAPGPKIAP
jgi:hypothetical protein